MTLIILFFEFIKIGAFSFGGGLGTLPYIYEMAEKTGWINADYIGKILAVSQVTPGPLACNIGSIVGFKVNGVIGAFIANLGFIIPAIFFMGISYKLLNKIKENKKADEVIKMVRSSALAVMIGTSTTLFKNAFLIGNLNKNFSNFFSVINIKSLILCAIIFIICKLKKLNSLYLILISAVIGVIIKV